MGKYTKKSPKREENFYESFKINIYYTKNRSDMCYFVTRTPKSVFKEYNNFINYSRYLRIILFFARIMAKQMIEYIGFV